MKEQWKTIENFPKYLISNLGNVKSLKRNKEMLLKPKHETGDTYDLHTRLGTAYVTNN